MPINGIPQPDILQIDDTLRLKKFNLPCDFALPWYQDPETLYLVDGNRTPYTLEKLHQMYAYLNNKGELYFIEALAKGHWQPVGDVTFWQEDMPIVIGDKAYRHQGIGQRVVGALISRAKTLGFKALGVAEIYHYNRPSQKLFEGLGFQKTEETQEGQSYCLIL